MMKAASTMPAAETSVKESIHMVASVQGTGCSAHATVAR